MTSIHDRIFPDGNLRFFLFTDTSKAVFEWARACLLVL